MKITQLWAMVMADAGPDDEGVPAIKGPTGMVIPLMGADMQRMESFTHIAQELADMQGKPVELRRFSNMEVVRIFEPTPPTKGKG